MECFAGAFMKFKYLAGLFLALSFNTGFAATAEIMANDYQGIYEAFTRGAAGDINAALKNNQGFNHKADGDSIRSSAAGLALRTAVIGLGFDDLKTVVETNHAFFETSLGMSLLYGWLLNQFKDPITPYYIGHYFSFDKLLQGMTATQPDKKFFTQNFTRGLPAVEGDRWAFYDHMLYLPYAIAQVRLTAPAAVAAPSVDRIIADARRSAVEAQEEAQMIDVIKRTKVEGARHQADAVAAAAAQQQREAHQKAVDYAIITAPDYMDYATNLVQYPAKVGNPTFQQFKKIMVRYANLIPEQAEAIRKLKALKDNQDLHGESGKFSPDGGYKYQDRRADIDAVLTALKDKLRP